MVAWTEPETEPIIVLSIVPRREGDTWLFEADTVECALHMAITRGAKKAIRSQERKRVYNVRTKRAVAVAVKAVPGAVGKDRAEQQAVLARAYQALDKAAKRGTIKKNTASRKKSRLAKRLKASAQ